MEKEQNCWEFMKCDACIRGKCPAYTTKSGRECWLIASSFCLKSRTAFKYCWECPWFKKLNSGFDKK